jgi:hypothetical protein
MNIFFCNTAECVQCNHCIRIMQVQSPFSELYRVAFIPVLASIASRSLCPGQGNVAYTFVLFDAGLRLDRFLVDPSNLQLRHAPVSIQHLSIEHFEVLWPCWQNTILHLRIHGVRFEVQQRQAPQVRICLSCRHSSATQLAGNHSTTIKQSTSRAAVNITTPCGHGHEQL